MQINLFRAILSVGLLQTAVLAQPGLTIYSGKFAVVRDVVPLELKAGLNQVRYSGATAGVDPSSVILRDPAGKVALEIMEQDYLNHSIYQNTLLELYEGQVIGFLMRDAHGGVSVAEGKVIRAGREFADRSPMTPLVEYGGKLLFELPGTPLFPALKDDNILKPLLTWKIQSPVAATCDAELAYLTSGLGWEAAYNLVLEPGGEKGDMNCWVTIRNDSGKTFEEAQIKLIAGDVHRAPVDMAPAVGMMTKAVAFAEAQSEPAVQEKKVDEYHLYTMPRAVTLRDSSVKQVEFARAAAIPTRRIYLLDAAPSLYPGEPILERDWGTGETAGKVQSILEFENNPASSLGIPLPAGVLRVYRKEGAQLEFIGEDQLNHTPAKAKVKVTLGNAFDLSGVRHRVDFKMDQRAHHLDESFEIVLKNGGKTPVEITVVEHLSRSAGWKITQESAKSTKVDSHTVQFQIPVAAESGITLSYAVRYTW